MFCLNHRSIKVTLFSKIHIKIISKISLTYHQIASLDKTILLFIRTLLPLKFLLYITMFLFGNQLIAFKIQFDNIWHPIYNSQKIFTAKITIIKIQYRTKGSTMGSYNNIFIRII